MKRLERALEVAKSALYDLGSWHDGTRSNIRVGDILAEIDAILHPVEVEEVTVEMWARYKHGTLYDSGLTEEDAKRMAARNPDVYQAVRLVGTIRREKKVVERSVSVEARIDTLGCNELLKAVSPVWVDHPECHGKTGTLTFEWTE